MLIVLVIVIRNENFFERQAKQKLNSKKMTMLLCITLVLMVISIYLGVKLHDLNDKLVSLQRAYQDLSASIPPSPSWPEGITRDGMIDQLVKNKELFPWHGVLGGTMDIYDQNQVWFIGPAWCMAYIEDGHMGGYMLLRYKITKEGIEWRLIDSEEL